MNHSWQALVDELRGAEYQFGVVTPGSPRHRVEFDRGLTKAEVAAAESTFGFRFPPDLCEFLQTALPRGPVFPDWRAGEQANLRQWLDQPRQGILFDVEYNRFWLKSWGPRPELLKDAVQAVSDLVAAAPKLIPIYLHRMIPDEPHVAGNPVFSVHQSDIIYYGADLRDYLTHEFLAGGGAWSMPDEVRSIRFWEGLVG